MTKFAIPFLLLNAAFLVPAVAQVSGAIEVAGASRPVKFACGYEEESPFDPAKNRIYVVLSSSGPENLQGISCRAAENRIRQKSQEDGDKALPYLTVRFDGAKMQPNNWTLVVYGQFYSFTLPSPEPESKPVLATGPGGATLRGRLTGRPERITSDFPETALDVHLQDIPFDKLPPKTEEVTGPAARKHPAALAALQVVDLMSKGDVAGLRRMIVEAELAAFDKVLASPDKAQYMEVTRTIAADLRKATSLRVSNRGGVYQVTFENRTPDSRESMNLYMVKERGMWRMAPER